MSDEVEWGPWVEHDGNGCPVEAGTIVETIRRNGSMWCGPALCFAGDRYVGPQADDRKLSRWWWACSENIVLPSMHIIRYRIRKPRGLTILESLLENLPEEVDA